MPEITRNQTNTVHGLLLQANDLDLTVPAAWEMLGQYLDEAKAIQEAVCRSLDKARFEQTWGQPLSLEQDDSAAADGTEVPIHPVFLQMVGFMAPQKVRR